MVRSYNTCKFERYLWFVGILISGVFPLALLAESSQNSANLLFHQQYYCTELSRAVPVQPQRAAVSFCDFSQPVTSTCCTKSIDNSCLCRIPEKKTFSKVSVFSSQFFRSHHIFSSSHPILTSNIFCVLLFHQVHFQLFQESCLATAAENTAFPVRLFHNKSFIKK